MAVDQHHTHTHAHTHTHTHTHCSLPSNCMSPGESGSEFGMRN